MTDPEREAVLAEARQRQNAGDSFHAADLIVKSSADALEAAGLFADFAKQWYWAEKDLPAAILAFQAGLHFTLGAARAADETDPDAARALRQKAMAMSFNLASFCWPAWEEPLIVVDDHDVQIGFDAAYLHRRLALELGVPPEKESNAHWIVGALYLALDEYFPAARAFEIAAKKAAEAGTADSESMNRGYWGIASILDGRDDEGRRALDEAVARLRASGSEDAVFFADQLEKVSAYFTR